VGMVPDPVGVRAPVHESAVYMEIVASEEFRT
jgi:hypothetical protein